MASAEIRVELSGGREVGGLTCYAPGAQMYGVVQVTPRGSVRCNHLWVRVQWRTEGRGDRDTGKLGEADLFQGDLRTDVPGSYPFQFLLPYAPWSYAGHYVSIVWEVAVDVDVPWSVNPRFSRPFVMAPPPVGTPEEQRYDVWITGMGSGQDWSRVMRGIALVAPAEADALRGRTDTGGSVRVLEGVSQEAAEGARVSLEAAGAVVEVRPGS